LTAFAEIVNRAYDAFDGDTRAFAAHLGVSLIVVNRVLYTEYLPPEAIAYKIYRRLGISAAAGARGVREGAPCPECAKCFNMKADGICTVWREPASAPTGEDGRCRGYHREPFPCASCGALIYPDEDEWEWNLYGEPVCREGDDEPSAGNFSYTLSPLARARLHALGYV
jgi:hypothetical protein